MCEKDFTSTNQADLEALNHHIFCYLIPNELMFSDAYWKWRLTNPSEREIYRCHLDFYQTKLGLPKSVFVEQEGPKRLETLLESRNCDREIIEAVLEDNQDFEVDYYAATSKFVYDGKPHWRLNKLQDGRIVSRITIPNIEEGVVDFYPMDDVAAFTKVYSISVNGRQICGEKDFEYMRKVAGHYTLDVKDFDAEPLTIECVWQYKKIFEYLNS